VNHKHQTAQAIWISHQIISSLVLKIVGIMHRVHRAFEAFDNLDWELAWFVEQRILLECDQVLVPWSRDIQPWLT
jgi:hypothetical protein